MAAAGSKQSYVRFHVRVDEALDRAVESTGLKRATLTAWILSTFVRRINEHPEILEKAFSASREHDDTAAAPLTPEALGLSAAASLYALKIGRTVSHAPRSIGRPILLTLQSEIDSQLHMLADLCGMSINHFRSAVVASFLIEQKVLQ
ncbi:MAG: hypothetical protein IJY66_00865 [Clostridia bacterium]|nr:hypothetical protein [Clostridia bacterium]